MIAITADTATRSRGASAGSRVVAAGRSASSPAGSAPTGRSSRTCCPRCERSAPVVAERAAAASTPTSSTSASSPTPQEAALAAERLRVAGLRPDRHVFLTHLHDLEHGRADRASAPARRCPAAQPAAVRVDGPRELRHRASGSPTAAPARSPRSGTPLSAAASPSARSPATSATSAPGRGSSAGCAPPACAGAAHRAPRPDGPSLPGDARRRHRPHAGARAPRRPRRGARVRRPARPRRGGRATTRSRQSWTSVREIFELDESVDERRPHLGGARRARPRNRWSPTSRSTPSPTTTAASRASCTSVSAPA